MRAVLVAVCLSMVVFVTANNLYEGRRQEGDVHVTSERFYRPAVPGKPMVAKTGHHTEGEITAVTAVNARGSDAKVSILKGGPGQHYIVVTAISEPESGLDVQVDIYATKSPRQSEEIASS